ncbi:MAG: DUF6506 family protein [Oscillospiraceae bacterium]
MKKKFAFLLLGAHYDPAVHQAQFETEHQMTRICTVRSFDEARERIAALDREGFGAIELCGAFGPEKAAELIALTHNRVAIGFVTHLPEQDALFEQFFAKG